MTTVNVTTSSTLVAAAGNRDFLHIYNASDVTIYLCYDGTTAATVAAGIPLAPEEYLNLDNDGSKPIFTKAVYAIHGGSGNKELRLEGV